MVKHFSRKHLVAVAIALGLFVVGVVPVFAAYNTVQFTADTTISLTGLGTTITVKDGSNVSSFEVGASTITVVLVGDSNGYSSITFESADKYEIDSDDGASATCGGAGTTLTFNVGDIKTRTIIVYPRDTTLACSGSTVSASGGTAAIVGNTGGGGGGSSSSQTTQQTSSPSIEVLQAQITQLLAQVAALQSQLGVSSGGTGQQISGGAFVKSLVYGMKGDSEVVRLQNFLISKGHLASGLNTGNFLSKTLAAVRAYQASKGIQQTGNVGPLTRAAINAELGN